MKNPKHKSIVIGAKMLMVIRPTLYSTPGVLFQGNLGNYVIHVKGIRMGGRLESYYKKEE